MLASARAEVEGDFMHDEGRTSVDLPRYHDLMAVTAAGQETGGR